MFLKERLSQSPCCWGSAVLLPCFFFFKFLPVLLLHVWDHIENIWNSTSKTTVSLLCLMTISPALPLSLLTPWPGLGEALPLPLVRCVCCASWRDGCWAGAAGMSSAPLPPLAGRGLEALPCEQDDRTSLYLTRGPVCSASNLWNIMEVGTLPHQSRCYEVYSLTGACGSAHS